MRERIRALVPARWRLSHQNPTKNSDCTEFEVDNWAVSQFVLGRLVSIVGTEPFPLHELMLLVATVCRVRPTLIFEWGTHIGKSARIFYEITSHYRIDAEIHSVDLPDDVSHVEHPGLDRGRLVRGLPRVSLYQGDGLATSLELWQKKGRRRAPLFLLDGDHSYESVLRELREITRAVPNATILVHDTFYQSKESGYNVGPHDAIEKILGEAPGRYRKLHSGMGLPGLTLLYS